ncbi:MAG: DUF1501 domain-containing protein [Planctomycetota bacterium]
MNMNVDRRQAMKSFSTAIGSLAFASMLTSESLGGIDETDPLAPKETHFPARAKSVIMLYMAGAPSHIDTFDYKPQLIRNDGRSGVGRQAGKLLAPPWEFRQRGESGLWISDLFPNVGEQADELCLLHGMHCDQPTHATATRAAHTGSSQFIRPSLGAWSVYGLGTENTDLPGFVALEEGSGVNFGSAFLPARYQATTVRTGIASGGRRRGGNDSMRRQRQAPATEQESVENIRNSSLDLQAQRTQLDLLRRLNEAKLRRDVHQPQVEGIMQSYELAFRMQSSMPQLMDFSSETEATKAMYGIGEEPTNSFGSQCLAARRMVEAGVRFIELTNRSWDHHTELKESMESQCAQVDKPIAALIADLKQRGLLDDTLVIWGGEFGRTPHVSNLTGRGHNNKGYTTWMAGGGVKGGFAYGATDELGYEAVDGLMHTHDWHATILHLLGLDHERLTYRYAGRDFRLTDVHGKVATEILA